MPALTRETVNIARAMRKRVEREFGELLEVGEPDLLAQLQGYAQRSRDGALKQLSDRLADLLEASASTATERVTGRRDSTPVSRPVVDADIADGVGLAPTAAIRGGQPAG